MGLKELLGLNNNNDIDINAVMGGLVKPLNLTDIRVGSTGKQIPVEKFAENLTADINATKQNDNNINAYKQAVIEADNVINKPLSLKEKLFGAERPQTYTIAQIKDDNGNVQTNLEFGEDKKKVHNGWLNDFASGYKDNYNNSFSVGNWNTTDKAKSIAERLGEGVGSAMRFIDSPGGRALITSGIGLGLGVNPALSFAYGLNAGNTHSQLETENKAYRQLLDDQGLEADKLGRGWVDRELAQTYMLNKYRSDMANNRNRKLTADEYKQESDRNFRLYQNNMISPELFAERQAYLNQQFKDEGIYTGQDFDGKKLNVSNQTRNANINEALAPHRMNALDTGAMVGLGNLGLRRELLPYQMDNLQTGVEQKRNNINNLYSNVMAVKNQIDLFRNQFDKVATGKGGAIASNIRAKAGFGNADETYFNSQIGLLRNKIVRDLGGEKGVLSDQDMKFVEVSIPKLSDSLEQKKAKLRAIDDLIDLRFKQYQERNGSIGYRPQNTTTKNGIKYKVVE